LFMAMMSFRLMGAGSSSSSSSKNSMVSTTTKSCLRAHAREGASGRSDTARVKVQAWCSANQTYAAC
jgi:hypothetical protein